MREAFYASLFYYLLEKDLKLQTNLTTVLKIQKIERFQ
jgi:hypothetical protein